MPKLNVRKYLSVVSKKVCGSIFENAFHSAVSLAILSMFLSFDTPPNTFGGAAMHFVSDVIASLILEKIFSFLMSLLKKGWRFLRAK